MNPGRELDAYIAKNIFQYVIIFDSTKNDYFLVDNKKYNKIPLPEYSTKIEKAYEIVKFFKNKGFVCSITSEVRHGKVHWYSTFLKSEQDFNTAEGVSLPHAVCLSSIENKYLLQ